MADEVTMHNEEMMSICIRYVDQMKRLDKYFYSF